MKSGKYEPTAQRMYVKTLFTFLISNFRRVLNVWIWNKQNVPKCSHVKFIRRGITQKKAYNFYLH